MRVVHLARRPISEATVGANALLHGTGAINIDGTRIASPGEEVSNHSRSAESAISKGIFGDSAAQETHQTSGQMLGRWPANVILQHRVGCTTAGLVEVKAKQLTAGRRTIRWGVGEGGDTYVKGTGAKFATANGKDLEMTWECASGCPAADLDAQSRDSGGASRFFKQVKENDVDTIPADLVQYLNTLISPTHLPDCNVLLVDHPESFPWSEHADATAHGIIAMTTAKGSAIFEVEMWRVLKPGGHVLLVAPADEKTGHTGACALEDTGFEIRDAILWVQEPGHYHYVAKPPGRERHSGCENLKFSRKLGEVLGDNDEELDPEDLAAAMAEAEAAVDDVSDANHAKGNIHPTCKPKDMMARLLQDIPRDQGPVIDPFMGSGTTGLACLETGHNFIGVEKEPEYLEIADTRIKWWDRRKLGSGVEIRSDHKPKELPKVVQSLEDFFDV